MNNYFDINNKELCCGCSACVAICPVNAIEMILDKEGFLYPKVNNGLCINCILCKKVCIFAEYTNERR